VNRSPIATFLGMKRARGSGWAVRTRGRVSRPGDRGTRRGIRLGGSLGPETVARLGPAVCPGPCDHGAMSEVRTVGIGAGAKELATEDMVLNIGPSTRPPTACYGSS